MKIPKDMTLEIVNELKCKTCGATLKFAPGTKSLQCTFCQTVVEIKSGHNEEIEEMDLEHFLQNQIQSEEKSEVVTVSCNSCNAKVTLLPNVTSDSCPFCGTSLVIKKGSTSSILKPKSILPFNVSSNEAQEHFSSWIGSLWFAPNNLKKLARGRKTFSGVYIPYWSFDASTGSYYTGQRGDHYYDTETYTSYENGKSVTKTRTVTRTSWRSVSGHVARDFDDLLVIASKSLPREYAEALEPWDLSELTPFDEKYLSGFRTESYQIDVPQGWVNAKERMEDSISEDVRHHIGGDQQRITSLKTTYRNTKFKHTLLPIWISSYRYYNKIYRFMINGRTGEVQGERPYSWIKITFAVLVILSIITAVLMMNS